MIDHTVSSYQDELNNLMNLLEQMSSNISQMLDLQNKAMQNFGKNYTENANEIDKEINLNEESIEKLAVTILATRQPLAIDLRFVLSSIKIGVILERVGDLCKNVVKRSSAVETSIVSDFTNDLSKMNLTLLEMIKKVILCLKKWDEKTAISIIDLDAKIDSSYSMLMNKISSYTADVKQQMSDSIQLVMASKNIERIGDYIVKVAKVLYYINTGKKIL